MQCIGPYRPVYVTKAKAIQRAARFIIFDESFPHFCEDTDEAAP